MRYIRTLLVVVLAFVLFRADTLGQGFGVIGRMFSGGAGTAAVNAQVLACVTPLAILSFVFAVLLSTPVFRVLREKVSATKLAVKYDYLSYAGALVIFGLSVLSLVSTGYNPFIYFRF